jgi:glycine hydroxymethyltransferase
MKADCIARVDALCERFPLYPNLNIPQPALA